MRPDNYLASCDPEATNEIEAFVGEQKTDKLSPHENITHFFEHGQWWAACGACGASWSVVDCNAEEFDLEEVDAGDGSCLANA